jgi:predicted aspartyl protease
VFADDRWERLFVHVRLAGERMPAVVDTGGAYIILNPDFASAVGLTPTSSLGVERIQIRGITCHGTVHRVPLTFLAVSGDSLSIEATAFVPELEPGERWPLPGYLGLQGCLDRLRFAVDPVAERFYFGSAEESSS